MSDSKSFQCPNCGSPIIPSGSEKQVKCAYCGSTVIVPEELRDQTPPPSDFSIPQSDFPNEEVIHTIGTVGKVTAGVVAGTTVMSFVLPIVMTCIILGVVGGVLYAVFSGINSSNQAPNQSPSLPAIPFMASPTLVPTPVPTAINTPVPFSKVLFKDNFTDPSSGWERARNSKYTLEYKTGKYHVLLNSDPGTGQAIWITKPFTDMSVEADTQETTGPSDGLIGLACRAADNGRMYTFEYSQDGTYGIYKYSPDGSAETLDENTLNPNTIVQGGVNHLEGVCSGDTLTLILNGQILDQVEDSEYTKGGMGIIVRSGSSGETGIDALFSNYVVKGP